MEKQYKALMLGDVIGNSGIETVRKLLPALASDTGADFITANAENAAGGFGLTSETASALFEAGIDCLTSGNHIWEKKGIRELLDSDARILRPANYPQGAPGTGFLQVVKNQALWTVINLQGREDMTPLDSPFSVGMTLLNVLQPRGKAQDALDAPIVHLVLVDFHAESFDEKEALSLYLDGKTSAFAGTHTHIQTADERILPHGCGYIGDLGMCGPLESVIGVQPKSCLQRNLTQMPIKMEVAEGPACLSAALFTFNEDGLCVSVERKYLIQEE